MTITIEMLGIIIGLLVQAGGGLWWLSSLSSRVASLEKWADDHSEIRQQVATLGQAMHDLKSWMQRIDGRLDGISRSVAGAE